MSPQSNDPLTIEASKLCSRCRLILPFHEFTKSPSGKSGYRSQCRKCEKRYRLINRDRHNSQNKARKDEAKQAFRQITPHSIYFIASPYKLNHVKIGYTSNPRKRFQDFLSATSGRLLLLALIEASSPDEELSFHRLFDSLRIGNTEWFEAKAPLLRYLSSLDQSLAFSTMKVLTTNQQSRIIIPPIDYYIDKLPF